MHSGKSPRLHFFAKLLNQTVTNLVNYLTRLVVGKKDKELLEECTGNLEQTPEYILVEEILKMYPVAIVLLQI